MDWNTALYNPLYSVLGVPAVINTGRAQYIITAINQTSGIEINSPGVELPTLSPAAFVRASEMASNGLKQESLLGATLTIDGTKWTIDNVAERPGPNGKASGEWLLMLVNGDL